MTQIAFAGVGVDFGDTTLFSNVSFTVAPGERWGIVSRNGSGKTTLFRLLTGELGPTRGSIARAPGARVSLLEQPRDFGGATTVWGAGAGGLAALPALGHSCATAAFVTHRADGRLTQRRAYEQQQRTIAHEQDYIARKIAGQNTRQAKGRRKRLARLPRLSRVIGAEGTMAVRLEVPERGGDQLVS